MRCTLSLLVLCVACADTTPPTWPSDGEVEVVEVGTNTAEIRWPTASDDEAVALYRIRKEGVLFTDVGASTMQEEVDELDEASAVRLSVEAVDDAGNASEPLYVDVTTRDGTPPRWPTGATLTATAETTEASPDDPGTTSLSLEWTPAEDNLAVTGYVIMRGGDVLAEPGADATTFRTDGSMEGVRILAVDEAGNRSAVLSATAPGAVIADATPTEEAPAEAAPTPTSAAADMAPVKLQLSPAVQRSLSTAFQRMPRDRPLQVPAGMVQLPR